MANRSATAQMLPAMTAAVPSANGNDKGTQQACTHARTRTLAKTLNTGTAPARRRFRDAIVPSSIPVPPCVCVCVRVCFIGQGWQWTPNNPGPNAVRCGCGDKCSRAESASTTAFANVARALLGCMRLSRIIPPPKNRPFNQSYINVVGACVLSAAGAHRPPSSHGADGPTGNRATLTLFLLVERKSPIYYMVCLTPFGCGGWVLVLLLDESRECQWGGVGWAGVGWVAERISVLCQKRAKVWSDDAAAVATAATTPCTTHTAHTHKQAQPHTHDSVLELVLIFARMKLPNSCDARV